VSEVGRIGGEYSHALRFCLTLLNMRNEGLQLTQPDYDKKFAESWVKYEQCQEEARSVHARESNNLVRGIPVLLAIDAGSLGFGWLLIWLIACVVRWVRRGFTSSGEH
jgi:hypothetical protein